MVDCSPPWSYRPTFTSGATPTTIPSFTETRSRRGAGGTFFRSKGVGDDKNTIQIEASLLGGDFILKVYKGGTLVEGFGPYAQTEVPGDPITCTGNVIGNFRSDVNSTSNYIEMPSIDYGGAPDGSAGLPTFDASLDDAECFSVFAIGFLAGATGGPTDDSGLAAIRTGHDRTMIAISSTELVNDNHTDDGKLYLPTPARRVQQWNGTSWVAYTPADICP